MSKSGNLAYRAVDAALRTALRRVPASSLAESIALNWGYRYRPEPRAVRLRSGALLQTTHVDHLQLLLYYLGTFEPKALAAMRLLLKPGGTLLDVGANIGLFALEGAQAVGPTGKVIAIEAAPHHAKSVAASAALNGMTNIEVVPFAVGDQDGEATLTLPSGANFGMFTLGKVAGSESFKVSIRRIDDIVGTQKIDFIKMDIEGSEHKALLGARKIIERDHPPILIELNEIALQGCGSSSRQVKQLLADLGYAGKMLDGSTVAIEQSHICDECIFTAL